jgi:capsular exopolysaccharide synthesis family protein
MRTSAHPSAVLRPIAAGGESTRKFEFSPSVLMVSAPNRVGAEAIRALRTHLMAQHLQEGRRALSVCAASDGVGCTFVATNLAVALSQIGVKTLLIDADMRRPEVDRYIHGNQIERGLVQCLSSDEVDFGSVIEADVLPNLSIIFSGGQSSAAQDLLAGERFRDLAEFCLREFDMTVIDTPPANLCADARRVATVLGYSVIVTRQNRTFIEDVKVLAAQLASDHAKVVGTILNEG